MIRLNFIEVIVFYEVPQIFIATDIFDTKYLCLLYPHDDELCYKYLAVRISEKRLNLFKGQIIDLLSIYQDPEDGCYFDVVVKDANDIIATSLPANQIQPFIHSNTRFEPYQEPMLQLMATLDPQTTERGQGSNPQPHGS